MHGLPEAWARGALAPPGNVGNVGEMFRSLVMINVVESLSGQSVYALFSKYVVSFWGLDPAGDFCPTNSLICHP